MELHAPLVDAPPLYRYGLPELVNGVAPGADTSFTAAVDGAFFLRLVSVYVTLTTDANAADRYLSIQYRDDAGRAYHIDGAPVAVTANSVQVFSFGAFIPRAEWPVGDAVISPLSPLILPPTHSWAIVMTDAEAGDTLTTIRYVRERFFTTNQPSTAVPFG